MISSPIGLAAWTAFSAAWAIAAPFCTIVSAIQPSSMTFIAVRKARKVAVVVISPAMTPFATPAYCPTFFSASMKLPKPSTAAGSSSSVIFVSSASMSGPYSCRNLSRTSAAASFSSCIFRATLSGASCMFSKVEEIFPSNSPR